MWLKVSAQRHTHTESPPTFFIPLNCKPSKPGLSLFFFIHMYKHLFCDILHVLRIAILFLCVCQNVLWKVLLSNVWSKEVESMCFHCVCYLVYTDTCPLFYMKFYIYTPLRIWVHPRVLLQLCACVLTFEICVTFDATLYIWHHLHIMRLHINMSLRYLFRVNINIQLSIYILFVNLNLILLY